MFTIIGIDNISRLLAHFGFESEIQILIDLDF
jgi:hypothetical protein